MIDELIFELSHNCNLRCVMCSFGGAIDSSRFMDVRMFEKIVLKYGKITHSIRLNGRGESTIHPDFRRMLYSVRNQFNVMPINLFTNMMTADIKIVDSFVECGVTLFVSRDSCDNLELSEIRKGANLRRIEQNLANIEDIDPRPTIVFTLQHLNFHRVFDIAEYALNHDCSILYNVIHGPLADPLIALLETKSQWLEEQFYRVNAIYSDSKLQYLIPSHVAGIPLNIDGSIPTCGAKDNCDVMGRRLCVFYDGKVGPCNMLNPYYIGNMLTDEIEDIVSGELLAQFQHEYRDNKYCRNCANMGI